MFHHCAEYCLYIHKGLYIVILNLSVLGNVSIAKQPVIRISKFMLMNDDIFFFATIY